MFKVEYQYKQNLRCRNIFDNFDEAFIFYYKCLFNNIKVDLPKEINQVEAAE